jgi:hypothetical protein
VSAGGAAHLQDPPEERAEAETAEQRVQAGAGDSRRAQEKNGAQGIEKSYVIKQYLITFYHNRRKIAEIYQNQKKAAKIGKR